MLTQKNLAATLETMAREGATALHGGAIGEAVAAFLAGQGGMLTLEDLAAYRPEWQEPLAIEYRGYRIVTTRPNSNAFQMLETLLILENFDLKGMGHNSAAYLHTFAEAAKLAVTDRCVHCGDPAFYRAPLETLLSREYTAELARKIDPGRAAEVCGERLPDTWSRGAIRPGVAPEWLGGETTHIVAIDGDGMAASITQTLGESFGCAMVMGETGLLFNNLMDWFEINPEVKNPNLMAPGKRCAWNMAPVQVFREGRLVAALGTPGGYGILQTTPQMLLNLLEFGMDIQEAIEAPRARVMGGVEVMMESRVGPAVREELAALGHQVRLLPEFSMEVGGAQGIAVHPESGSLMAGADPRRDGYALAC